MQILVIARDITDKKQIEQRILHQASHDTLTGLPNRKMLDERFKVAKSLADRNSKQMGLLFLDLDKFKHINDTLGHHIGDIVLKSVAERLNSSIRDSDLVARIGGDEFLVLASQIKDHGDLFSIAEKLLETMREPIYVEGQNLLLSTSIGLALFPKHGEDLYTLIKRADKALYHAKNSGRNQYQLFTYES